MKKALVFAFLAVLLSVGCASKSTAPAAPSAGNPVMLAIAEGGPDAATVAPVGVRLTREHAITDHYGFILGYFNGTTSFTSEVVHLTAGTQVRFFNVDASAPHTVSFLGKATATTAPWPRTFDGSFTRSPAGTAIGTAHFSTGPLNPGQQSLVYKSGLPGFYMVGCAFHYDSNKMRTVIIVH